MNDVYLMSWWPRCDTWDKCSLNVGYWTPYCESWFVNHLKAIRNGTFQLRTATHWRRSLKHAITAQKVQKGLDDRAKDFLANNRLD